jgi:hypothetical protein
MYVLRAPRLRFLWCIRDLKTALRHAVYTVLEIPLVLSVSSKQSDCVGFGATTALHDHCGTTVCIQYCIHPSHLADRKFVVPLKHDVVYSLLIACMCGTPEGSNRASMSDPALVQSQSSP